MTTSCDQLVPFKSWTELLKSDGQFLYYYQCASHCKNRITCLRQFNKKVYKHLIMLQKQQTKLETQTGCISGLFYIKELVNIEKFVNNSVRPI